MSLQTSIAALVTAAILAAPLAVVAAQRPGGAAPSIEQQVVSVSNQWAEAAEHGDVEAAERLLADDFVTIQQTASGVALVTKPDQIESLRQTAIHVPRLRRSIERIRVRTHGNVAILTAVASYRVQTPTGEKLAIQAVISEVWVNAAGRWQLTHFQPTAVTPQAR